ncbi:hypothetical protein TNCT_219711 [Trichonephila clavata]|uniref:Uncharacterized protein n=1 Tax=Trichonephila clavata TaxID=2740835 RepID=A0A8X6EXX2_TRICU|nr:hypothetical protein TNCT_219711 [Trichonephila clavata]
MIQSAVDTAQLPNGSRKGVLSKRRLVEFSEGSCSYFSQIVLGMLYSCMVKTSDGAIYRGKEEACHNRDVSPLIMETASSR